MNLFYTIISLIIIFILTINSFALLIFGETFFSYSVNNQFYILSSIIFIESTIIILMVKYIFSDPIIKLEYTIKSFLVGSLKDKKIEFKETLNPHINYIFLFFSKTLNTLKNIKNEFLHGKEIKGEVELAREIQSKILEKRLLQVPSLNVICRTKPAREIGGDSYDIIKEGDNYYIYVGDATGHGVGAGFIMVMTNALISGFSKVFSTGNEILARTNEALKPRVKANLLMTLLLLRWNEKEKKMYMTGAGHEYLIIFKHNTQKCEKIKSSGVALGMVKDISNILKEKEIVFEKNDIIVLYSDGITESINQPNKDGNEQMFGENRLIEAIEETPNEIGKNYKTAGTVFNNITIELSKFMGYKHIQLDDITLCVINYRGEKYDINDDTYKELSDDFITEWNW